MAESLQQNQYDAIVLSSQSEAEAQKAFQQLLANNPLPPDEVLANLGLFLSSKTLSRLLFFYELYQKVKLTHGVVMEFGVRWGQTLSLLSALRGIFEPFNRHRKIIGFDTFAGFQGVSAEDGDRHRCKEGSFSVPENYEQYLSSILHLQEQLNPINHLKKYELVKGDVSLTLPAYLEAHPETIVSMAIFDVDIYKPTVDALKAIQPCLAKGSILVFDELCDDIFPGETLALKEVLGLRNCRIQRMPMTARISYLEIE
ncbi:MAG: crotonobetainyl-CoA--carnitine CoA-transferase [Candidatus Sericytochromatia bacterium]